MILEEIFAEQPSGFVFVSWKDEKWHDKSFESVYAAIEFINGLKDCDIYFSPTTYSKPERKKENVLPTKWLWQDLDAVKPQEISPKPTIAWESSPGRYQGLWKLDKVYGPAEAEAINKRLAHDVKADHGSWILTKVLRVPGTKNYKYPTAPQGKLLWDDGPVFKPKDIPANVQELLESEMPTGDRSNTLWFMEHELAKAGFNIDEIYAIVKDSVWNKYRGRSDEQERLMHEIALALRDHKPRTETSPTLNVTTHRAIMCNDNENPGWLIDEWWSRGSHGIIAGEPKSYKSTLAMDAAVSIASGKPFLGQYQVNTQGPVIIVQNENSDWIIRERMGLISTHRGISGSVSQDNRTLDITWPDDLPIYYINNQGFSLSNENHKSTLEDLIKEVKPVLIIFDPLYLMFDGDVNSAKDLNPALTWLIGLKHTYNLSVMLIHHWRKSQGQTKRGGQRMLGSTTLHGWVESAWYVQSGEEVTVEREFRAAEQPDNIKLRIKMNDTSYDVEVVGEETYDQDLRLYLESHPGVMLNQIASDLGLSERLVKRHLEKMKREVVLDGKKYSLASKPGTPSEAQDPQPNPSEPEHPEEDQP